MDEHKIMKSAFWRKFLALIVILSLVCTGGHWLYEGYAQKGDSASYIDKMERLKSLNGQKAVFIGGSATHFGVQAELFQRLTGISSVNMGLNAGISIGLYLDSVEPFLRPGDVLFITPEYTYFDKALYNCVEADVEFLLYYADETWPQFDGLCYLRMIQPTLYSGWKNVGAYIQDNLRDRLKKGDTLYLRVNSNSYGDMEGAKNWPQSEITPETLDLRLGDFAEELANRVEKLEMLGIQVYVCYPPYQRTSFDNSSVFVEQIHKTLKDQVPLLYEPAEAALLDVAFLDTVYHLTHEGAAEFTQMLAHRYLNEQYGNK